VLAPAPVRDGGENREFEEEPKPIVRCTQHEAMLGE